MPAVTNLTGSNPGPVLDTKPDITELVLANLAKAGLFQLTLSPASVAANTTAEQTFASTGIGLLVGDFVMVNKPTAQAGLGIVGMRVSAADTLAITFSNNTGSPIVPTASEVYLVSVQRPLASGNSTALTW